MIGMLAFLARGVIVRALGVLILGWYVIYSLATMNRAVLVAGLIASVLAGIRTGAYRGEAIRR